MWWYRGTTMATTRMQITLPREHHLRAVARAEALGISLAEYLRRLVETDLDDDLPRSDITELFGIGDSGGSDVARDKDVYLGEAAISDVGD